MKKVFWIDGGAGRVLAAIPALIKYGRLNPDHEYSIISAGFDMLYWGIPELQDRTYSPDTKGVFDNVISKADVIVAPEPYRNPAYFKQEISLAEAFDREINGVTDHSDLGVPTMVFNKFEKSEAVKAVTGVKSTQKKQKTVVFQPFGRGAQVTNANDQQRATGVEDEESRSLSSENYLKLVKKLALRYNMVFFGEPQFQLAQDTYAQSFTTDLRQWGAVIAEADYFIGVDSVGQHMARAVGTPGTVIIGSTFPVNTTYPDYFNVYEKPGVRKYSPIRLANLDAALSNRINEKTMEFTDEELNDLFKKICDDIDKKVK